MINAPLQCLALMLQQVDLQVAASQTRRARVLWQRQHVLHRTQRVQQRVPAPLVVDFLKAVEDAPELPGLLQRLLLLSCCLLLGGDLGGGQLRLRWCGAAGSGLRERVRDGCTDRGGVSAFGDDSCSCAGSPGVGVGAIKKPREAAVSWDVDSALDEIAQGIQGHRS